MGNNLDLVSFLGLPKEIKCPLCRKKIDSLLDDYDIECGKPDASKNNGLLTLHCYCSGCDLGFDIKVKSEIVE